MDMGSFAGALYMVGHISDFMKVYSFLKTLPLQ